MDADAPHPASRPFDFLRAAAIALLGGGAFAYLRHGGASQPRALAVALAGVAALAALWAAERLSGHGAPPAAPKAKKAGFDWGMHYLRGFAIVCIMLTHFFGRTGAAKFAHAFLTSSTIYFLFISGYLCQYLAFRRPVDPGKYYLSKLKNVVSPYIVCSLATIAAVLALRTERIGVIEPSAVTLPSMPDILLLGWAQRQYWYIPFVVLLFLVSPRLTRVSDRTLAWLTLVFFFLAVCFPHRPPSHLTWSLSKLLYRFAYFGWGYLIGFAYARWKDRIDPHLRAYVLPALLLGLALGIGKASWMPDHVLRGSFAWSLQKLFFLVPVLCVANWLRSTRVAILDWLATYSFTLFFLHYFFVRDYAVLQDALFARVHPGSFGEVCIRIGLAAAFVGQNLLLAVLLKKASGRWSRSVIGA